MLEPTIGTLLPALFRRFHRPSQATAQITTILRSNSTGLRIGDPISQGFQRSSRETSSWASEKRHTTGLLESCVWIICIVAATSSVFLIHRSGAAVDVASLLAALAIFGFLLTAHIVYRQLRPSPALSNLCGGLAAILLSGATAGIISLVGLRNNAPFIDAELANWDRAAGVDLPAVIAWVADHPSWSHLLAVTYGSSFPLLFAVTTALAITRRFDHLWILTFTFVVTILACAGISVIWPAKGAFAFFEYPASLLEHLPTGSGLYHLSKLDYFRGAASPLLSFANLQGVVTFPSFHCCLALMLIFATWTIRWLFPISLGWNSLVIMSTIPIGGHYAIDLPCGAIVWIVATGIAVVLASLRRDDSSLERQRDLSDGHLSLRLRLF
ncbi:phosphatase PAP2 family protein [Bradyrhizobium sp. HKCCYLS2038]|uniref:phosphatase PAP2 family protein n=1 Tax=unclassified Bradyrhizobium TaxID=2631580 RepID=UPI003EBAB56D